MVLVKYAKFIRRHYSVVNEIINCEDFRKVIFVKPSSVGCCFSLLNLIEYTL